ncbi:hypothetical protein V2L06_20390 [Pseudomonas alliivorans]|nr:hypothetical protein [Pseudomonas alliivorans]
MTTKPNSGTVSVSRELLPCPFCGQAARYVAADYVDNSGEPWPFAECDACSTGAPVEFWNKRAQPADQQGEPVAWTESDVLDFLSVALRHADYSGLAPTDILDGLRYMAEKGKPAYHAQPATAKVVLPVRKRPDPYCYDQGGNANVAGWNACLDEVAKLNGIET